MVAARDEKTGETNWQPVEKLFHNKDKTTVEISFSAQAKSIESIHATLNHPFWVNDKGWTPASKLAPGDIVVSYSGERIAVEKVSTDLNKFDTYNLQVKNAHTYFVGSLSIWVHNACSQGGATHDHHIFPQQFKPEFNRLGLNINDYTITVNSSAHLGGIHGNGFGGMPGKWNDRWRDFFRTNGDITVGDVFRFADSLLDEFGLNGLSVHPYLK